MTDLRAWLLDSDPALRWQVERDLADEPPEVWEATRARVPTEGFGARLLAHQDPDGQWAGGAFFPRDFEGSSEEGHPWSATTWTVNSLREWSVDAAVLGDTARLLAANCRWEYDNLPFWDGEVDCCINVDGRERSVARRRRHHQRRLVRRAPTARWRLEPRVGQRVHAVVVPLCRRAEHPAACGSKWTFAAGEPSKWLTLYGTRVLDWWDAA